MANSVFTDYLKTLVEYSEKVDAAEVSNDDYIEYQVLESWILSAYQKGYYNQQAYKALTGIYYQIKDNFRTVLGLERS